jgi:hypothetical protein
MAALQRWLEGRFGRQTSVTAWILGHARYRIRTSDVLLVRQALYR